MYKPVEDIRRAYTYGGSRVTASATKANAVRRGELSSSASLSYYRLKTLLQALPVAGGVFAAFAPAPSNRGRESNSSVGLTDEGRCAGI